MSMEDDIVVDIEPLRRLLKLLGGKKTIKIGIVDDSSRSDGEKTNAEIGAYHEYGLGNNPVRSFLRMPLATRLDEALSEAGAYVPKAFRKAIEEDKVDQFLEKIGMVGVSVVLKAFDSGGFGQWPESNMKRKKNHQTLVETQQLRNSITSKVEDVNVSDG